jgi:hypothetical protein
MKLHVGDIVIDNEHYDTIRKTCEGCELDHAAFFVCKNRSRFIHGRMTANSIHEAFICIRKECARLSSFVPLKTKSRKRFKYEKVMLESQV